MRQWKIPTSLQQQNERKHEITETRDYQIICIECGEILQEHILTFEYIKQYSRQSRSCTPHCTKKYFIKLLNKLSSLDQDYWVFISDFEEQETTLKEVLKEKTQRKNSLSVHYKLYKLLQRHGKFYLDISEVTSSPKLPKCHKTLTEHDRIMKEVWSRLDWDWITISSWRHPHVNNSIPYIQNLLRNKHFWFSLFLCKQLSGMWNSTDWQMV